MNPGCGETFQGGPAVFIDTVDFYSVLWLVKTIKPPSYNYKLFMVEKDLGTSMTIS